MKLYTRTGDDGSTGLFGGQRVGKDHPRVEAYGDLDELNAAVGVAAASCDGLDSSFGGTMRQMLGRLQSHLFDIGADLATPPDSPHQDKVQRFDASNIDEIETWIDDIDGGNVPMRSFVLPGGTELASRLHVARTVSRRAERAMVALDRADPVTPAALVYVNRVSDLLFAMARRANREAGVDDVPWTPSSSDG